MKCPGYIGIGDRGLEELCPYSTLEKSAKIIGQNLV